VGRHGEPSQGWICRGQLEKEGGSVKRRRARWERRIFGEISRQSPLKKSKHTQLRSRTWDPTQEKQQPAPAQKRGEREGGLKIQRPKSSLNRRKNTCHDRESVMHREEMREKRNQKKGGVRSLPEGESPGAEIRRKKMSSGASQSESTNPPVVQETTRRSEEGRRVSQRERWSIKSQDPSAELSGKRRAQMGETGCREGSRRARSILANTGQGGGKYLVILSARHHARKTKRYLGEIMERRAPPAGPLPAKNFLRRDREKEELFFTEWDNLPGQPWREKPSHDHDESKKKNLTGWEKVCKTLEWETIVQRGSGGLCNEEPPRSERSRKRCGLTEASFLFYHSGGGSLKSKKHGITMTLER